MSLTAKELEVKLKELNPGLQVVDNPNRPGLSNILFNGKNYDLPVLSTNCIKDEIDNSYRYEFPNGMSARYWSVPEVLNRIKDFLANFEKVKEDYEN